MTLLPILGFDRVDDAVSETRTPLRNARFYLANPLDAATRVRIGDMLSLCTFARDCYRRMDPRTLVTYDPQITRSIKIVCPGEGTVLFSETGNVWLFGLNSSSSTVDELKSMCTAVFNTWYGQYYHVEGGGQSGAAAAVPHVLRDDVETVEPT